MSSTASIVKKIERMMGNKYLYNHERLVINDVDSDDIDTISVFTTTQTFTFSPDEAERFIEDCEYIPDSSQMALVKPIIDQSTEMFASMKSIMEDTIKKVQEDKDYVPQATQINNSMKNMLEMSKQQIEVVKILKRS
ncbi:MAG: hypothetical protein AAGF85_00530 [Bacteroidota bacterium]